MVLPWPWPQYSFHRQTNGIFHTLEPQAEFSKLFTSTHVEHPQVDKPTLYIWLPYIYIPEESRKAFWSNTLRVLQTTSSHVKRSKTDGYSRYASNACIGMLFDLAPLGIFTVHALMWNILRWTDPLDMNHVLVYLILTLPWFSSQCPPMWILGHSR